MKFKEIIGVVSMGSTIKIRLTETTTLTGSMRDKVFYDMIKALDNQRVALIYARREDELVIELMEEDAK